MDATMITALATIVLAGFTAWLCWETRKQAKNGKKPILFPSDLKRDDINFAAGNLFIFNFTYPIIEDMGELKRGIYYVGIKNVGDGPAMNVCISVVSDKWKCSPETFTIPANGILPLIIRAAMDPADLNNFQDITIRYEDIFREKYVFQIQTNVRPNDGKSQEVSCPINVLRSAISLRPFPEPELPMHRELEWRGRYELSSLR